LKEVATNYAGPEIASRVIFTDVAPKHVHIHRGRIADLFLDTPECNAHTTAADILWSGTPLITFPKYDFKMCSRVAASLAYATGTWDLRKDGKPVIEDDPYLSPHHLPQFMSDRGMGAVISCSKKLDRLLDSNLLGHWMVVDSYESYEERAVRFAKGQTWQWKKINSWSSHERKNSSLSSVVQSISGFGHHPNDFNTPSSCPFFPSRQTPTHILVPSGVLSKLRRRLFLTRDKIPLFDTKRWVRNLEKGMIQAWRSWEKAWSKQRAQNELELQQLRNSGIRLDEFNTPTQPFSLKPSVFSRLVSRCKWVDDDNGNVDDKEA